MPLTTHATLPIILRRLAWRIEHGEVPPHHTERLAADAAAIERNVERDAALVGLAAMLPPCRSRWAKAGSVVDALARFQTAWTRIRRGGRKPRTPLETALARVLSVSDATPCQRSVWEVLKESRDLATIETDDSKTA